MKTFFKTVVIIILLAILGSIIYFGIYHGTVPFDISKLSSVFSKEENSVPDGYICVFHGGSGELTFETYIYKIPNGQDNYGYEYINASVMTTSWGSSETEITITGKGEFDWTDGAFIAAEQNYAYDYVTVPGDDTVYTIDEFMGIFLKK